MTTFERLYIADPAAHREIKDPYYKHIAALDTAERILREFGLAGAGCHIVNGHVPPSKGKAPSRAAGGSSSLTAASAVLITSAPALRAIRWSTTRAD